MLTREGQLYILPNILVWPQCSDVHVSVQSGAIVQSTSHKGRKAVKSGAKAVRAVRAVREVEVETVGGRVPGPGSRV